MGALVGAQRKFTQVGEGVEEKWKTTSKLNANVAKGKGGIDEKRGTN